MAVTTNKTPAAKAPAASKGAQTVVAAAVATMVLELALYQRYATDGRIYEAGVPYEFEQSVALEKLQEAEESGRPLWKLHKTKKAAEGEAPVAAKVPVKVDLTPKPVDGAVAVTEAAGSKRLEVGSEDDLKELGLTGDGKGDGQGGSDDNEQTVVV